MLRGRAEVLAEREHGDIGLAQVVHGLENLGFRLAESEHEAALGDGLRVHLTHATQHVEREAVFGAGADHRGQALHRLEVVVEDIRLCVDHGADRVVLAVEVRREHLDDDVGVDGADGLDRAGKMQGSSVGHVVAGDGGDDDMLELETADRLGDALGLVFLKREGFGRGNGAETAGAGAAFTAIMKVAVPWLQHSQRFGHWALSQTVCSFRSETSVFVEKKTGFEGNRTLIQSGFWLGEARD